MARERLTTVTLEDVLKMKDRTHENAPEGPSLPKDFWKRAKVVDPESPKEAVKLPHDTDMLGWFKTQGLGYQILMNDSITQSLSTGILL